MRMGCLLPDAGGVTESGPASAGRRSGQVRHASKDYRTRASHIPRTEVRRPSRTGHPASCAVVERLHLQGVPTVPHAGQDERGVPVPRTAPAAEHPAPQLLRGDGHPALLDVQPADAGLCLLYTSDAADE